MPFNETLSLWLDRFLMPLDEPGSRLFHWNIVVALILVAVWSALTFGRIGSFAAFRRLVFRKKYWWNRSTKRDYVIYLGNSVLKVLLFIPFLDFSFSIGAFVARRLAEFHGDTMNLEATTGAIALFTVFSFVYDDFLRFFQHWLMHRVPFLWRFHSVHHSAKILTPITLYRAHPIESAIATLRNSLSIGVSTGLFVFLFGAQLSLWTIAGVNVFGFLFNVLGANLRHSHIPISFPTWLEEIFISPLQHQIHHSSDPRHRDRNFGVSLSLWDRWVGAWVPSKALKPEQGLTGSPLRFGLGNRQRRSFREEMGL